MPYAKEAYATFLPCMEMGKQRNHWSNEPMASGIANRSNKIDSWVSYQEVKGQKSNSEDNTKWNKSKVNGLLSINHHKGKP